MEDRPVLEPNAAGIDLGMREMFVAVPPERNENVLAPSDEVYGYWQFQNGMGIFGTTVEICRAN